LLAAVAVSAEVGAVTSANSHPVVPFSKLGAEFVVDKLSGT